MRLRTVQVGYGYWGTNISRKLFASDRFDFVALCDNDTSRIEKAKSELSQEIVFAKDYRPFLENQDVDAFVIATQTEYSYEIGMEAMRYGKHVFMEKPLATTVERAERLKNQSRESGVVLHCDHIMIYNPYIRYIKSMYDTGDLGDLLYIDVAALNLGPIRKDINSLMDLAVHDIALIDWFSEGQRIESLSAYGEKPFGKQETLTYLTMRYASFIAHIKSSWISPIKIRQRVIAGTKKMVVFDDLSNERVKIYDCGIDVIPNDDYFDYAFLTRRGDIYIPNIEWEDSLQNSLEHFAECIEKGKESLSGPDASLRVMKILENAQKRMVS